MRFFLNILLCLPLIGFSQNYVQDGSFEDTIQCPYTDLSLTNWYRPSYGTSDLYCTCRPPDSLIGSPYQDKSAFDGDCFIGLGLHQPISGQNDPREYVESKLLTTLDSGQSYCVSLNVVHSTHSNYTIQNIHIGFRSDSAYQLNGLRLEVDTFYRFNNSILKDSVNWTRLELEFTATGMEKYLSIGNFDSVQNIILNDYNAMTTPPYLDNYAYYFFDLITLEKCTEPPPTPENHFAVYPNPSDGSTISIDKYNDTTAQLTLYNSIGQLVASKELATGTYNGVVFEHLASGVYVVVYETATGYRQEEKLIVSP